MTQSGIESPGVDIIHDTPDSGPRRRRKLSAIMMVDVSGFSAMMGADEDRTIGLIKNFHERVHALVAEHEGRVVDTAGDSVFGEFDSVVNAVRCARRIQEDQAARNAEHSTDEQIYTRIGVHLGDVVVENYRVYGDGVNIAARLEPIADPGGICISEAVYQQIRNKLDLPIQDLGVMELKNIQYPIHLYKVPPPKLIDGEYKARRETAQPAAQAPPPGAAAPAAPFPAAPGSGLRDAAQQFRRELEREITESVAPQIREAGEIAKREAKRAAEMAAKEAKRAAEWHEKWHGRHEERRKSREAREQAREARQAAREERRAARREAKERATGPSFLRSAETSAERALRSALGERSSVATPDEAGPPHERVNRTLHSWLDDVVGLGTLVPLIVACFLLLSPFMLFPTGGVFPTGGAILLSVSLGRVWAKRSGQSGNFLLALGIGIASGAIWTNWSGVTNSLFILAGIIVAATGLGGRRHRRRA